MMEKSVESLRGGMHNGYQNGADESGAVGGGGGGGEGAGGAADTHAGAGTRAGMGGGGGGGARSAGGGAGGMGMGKGMGKGKGKGPLDSAGPATTMFTSVVAQAPGPWLGLFARTALHPEAHLFAADMARAVVSSSGWRAPQLALLNMSHALRHQDKQQQERANVRASPREVQVHISTVYL